MQGQSQPHEHPEKTLPQKADSCDCPWKGQQDCPVSVQQGREDMPSLLYSLETRNQSSLVPTEFNRPSTSSAEGPALTEVIGCCRWACWPFCGLSPTAHCTGGWAPPTLVEHHPGPALCQGKDYLHRDCMSRSESPETAALHLYPWPGYQHKQVKERSLGISFCNLVMPLASVITIMRNTRSLKTYEKILSVFDPFI